VQRKYPMLTQFYSYFNTTLNLVAEKTATTDFKSPRAVAGWLGDMALLLAIPSILPAMLMHLLRGGGDDPEELAKHVIKWQAGYLMGLFVGIREGSGAIEGYDYAGPPVGRIVTDIKRSGESIGRIYEDGDIEDKRILPIVSLLGTAFGIPTVQAILGSPLPGLLHSPRDVNPGLPRLRPRRFGSQPYPNPGRIPSNLIQSIADKLPHRHPQIIPIPFPHLHHRPVTLPPAPVHPIQNLLMLLGPDLDLAQPKLNLAGAQINPRQPPYPCQLGHTILNPAAKHPNSIGILGVFVRGPHQQKPFQGRHPRTVNHQPFLLVISHIYIPSLISFSTANGFHRLLEPCPQSKRSTNTAVPCTRQMPVTERPWPLIV
jgi:hypothetical protein